MKDFVIFLQNLNNEEIEKVRNGEELSFENINISNELLDVKVSAKEGMNIASQCMHIKGKKIGQSLRMLSDALGDAGAENRVLKQLSALSTSKNRDEYSYHLRKIVYLLKSEKIPLDYGKLATDLYLLQYDEYASSVKLQWARDFYRKGAKKND